MKKDTNKGKSGSGEVKPAKKSARVLEMKSKPQPKAATEADGDFQQALQQYQEALRLMQEHKFDRAKALFQKVIAAGRPELMDRARVYLNTCNQHVERAAMNFKTPEEHYDYAVSLMNVGDYVGAREHLEKILKQSPNADYALYGMAVLNCLTGHAEDALHLLRQAIQVNPSARYQARNDSDFRNLADDPRFTELLYPEFDEPFPTGAPRR